ncbi:hypothetical protein B0T26DRAFT_754939 [Lasiosphaeria miniovina]|uniref:Uncharacterized protein n=1 Tax=Lasiosphaeria miniovina TaxID=1954250 RepID=A0AA40A5W4_9PEZI|nr:uncharacterized protein B0T26DRAFT_754939 [Lasiosphaeria miniovina]KAK0709785.1 hypothetical protein B0T26DRAFT_754939 [Lasiosphaeria miniovina]
MDSNGPSATDVITYIGVPLAVLGVLPILYNTVATLGALSRIKRILRHSRLTALTRSDVVNRVIEVELPRYAVTPWDRFTNRDDYWSLSRHPSSIPGGSWTTFNWRTNVIGLQTQRVEYADQLRQPQVEVAFEELVSYLLDLGAVPDAHGWRLLRNTGLWTPVGCALLMSPDGTEKSLTIAPLDGSDGHLSLAANWSSRWTTRDFKDLPPYWVRLPPPPPQHLPPPASSDEAGSNIEKQASPSAAAADEIEVVAEDLDAETSSMAKRSLESDHNQQHRDEPAASASSSSQRQPITCQISGDGIVTALAQEDRLLSSLQLDSLPIDHIRARSGRTDGTWFASVATAYGTSSQTILWNYRIPDDVIAFARKDSVPCGVLVLLGVVDEAQTPEWATQHADDRAAALDVFARRGREQRAAMDAESRMPPAQKAQAMRDRMMRENEQRLQEMRDKMRLENQRRETRLMEALQSPKWDNKVVAAHQLAWLKRHQPSAFPAATTHKDAVGSVLHRMVLDAAFAVALCRMLDLWKSWADNGGMRKSDMAALQEDLQGGDGGQAAVFAQATVLVAMIKDSSIALEGTLSVDLQECLRLWRTVRLG